MIYEWHCWFLLISPVMLCFFSRLVLVPLLSLISVSAVAHQNTSFLPVVIPSIGCSHLLWVANNHYNLRLKFFNIFFLQLPNSSSVASASIKNNQLLLYSSHFTKISFRWLTREFCGQFLQLPSLVAQKYMAALRGALLLRNLCITQVDREHFWSG